MQKQNLPGLFVPQETIKVIRVLLLYNKSGNIFYLNYKYIYFDLK